MKNISNDMKAHINQNVTNLCSCWKITKKNGVSLHLTDLDRDVFVDGDRYLASQGYDRDVLSGANGASTDEMEITGVLASDWITKEDLTAGDFDGAEVKLFLVNWADPTMGIIPLKRGWLGEVQWSENQFVAELRGLSDVLKREQSDLFTSECRADFCDTKCGLPISQFLWSDEVSAIDENGEIYLKDFDETGITLKGGVISFMGGANTSRSMEIAHWDPVLKCLKLFLPMPDPLKVGDAVSISAGCNKHFQTCKDQYSNQSNFRGFPDIPGTDRLLGG